MSDGEAGLHSTRKGVLRTLLFWEFPRASWPYDVVVGLILLFIFAIPREWFSDQPRAAHIVLLSTDHNSQQVYLEADLLSGTPETQRPQRAADLIRRKTGHPVKVSRVEPIRDDVEQEIKGFIAYTTP